MTLLLLLLLQLMMMMMMMTMTVAVVGVEVVVVDDGKQKRRDGLQTESCGVDLIMSYIRPLLPDIASHSAA